MTEHRFIENWQAEANKKYLRGDYKSAIKIYSKVIDSDALNYEAFFNRGMAYHDSKMYSEAIRDFTKSINLRQGFSEAYKCRALSYYSLNETKKALQDYNVATQLAS